MTGIAGRKPGGRWAINLAAMGLVLVWLLPTVGLFVTSLRSADRVAASGWWTALSSQDIQRPPVRIAGEERREEAVYVIQGRLPDGEIRAWGTSALMPNAYAPGARADLPGGASLRVDVDGAYRFSAPQSQEGQRLPRIFATVSQASEFTLDNYRAILSDPGQSGGMARAFGTTLVVAILATLFPITLAAFAAYALAWMPFPGRAALGTMILALLVVPLQVALLPVLKLHMILGVGKGIVGVCLAHTGFGLPLAIYLLRSYMAGLPRDVIENARIDGASELQIFRRIVLPLSVPALASLAAFQFMWTWNDLLVAKVFLLDASGTTAVMTTQIVDLMGSRGGNWEILAAAAFVSIIVPLALFFALQRHVVRGLFAGAVK